MREIKFRAWNKKEKKIKPVRLIELREDQSIWGCWMEGKPFDIKEVELMQFTGLKDKNGVELYEGDIVKVFFDERPQVIEYKTPCFAAGNRNIALADEVIGNIYENPELIEDKPQE